MKRTKVIAFYLPQFHRVPENDEWWGEGFTDWVSAKNAKPLYPGHYQPRLSDHDNYYDLLDKRTWEWQAGLLRKSGIEGICIYHYWFGEKQLLEKPAEKLLEWKDIDLNYCFSWANETWITSWSKLVGNAWTDSLKTSEGAGEKKGILIEQTYGEQEEWERHFYYLLPFFKDKRYIKKNGKPVFVIYKPENMKEMKQMIELWDSLAVQNGLLGIYFIGTNDKHWKQRGMDAALCYEPGYTLAEEQSKNIVANIWYDEFRKFLAEKQIDLPNVYSYKKTWSKILSRKYKENVYKGAFVNFDTTPRKGRKAIIFSRATLKGFVKYFRQLYMECEKNDSEFLFITAWNEWGEGAYLEPDKKYGVRYLNEIRKIIHQK